MHPTPSDLSERHAFIDCTVQSSIEAMRDPEVKNALGAFAIKFTDVLSSAVVTNIVMGEVQIPASYRDDEDRLPIVVIRPEETLIMSGHFALQTPSQRAATLHVFNLWEPRMSSAQNLYDPAFGHSSDNKEAGFSVTVPSVAMTGTYASLLGAERHLAAVFSKAPPKGIAIVKMRPALILKMPPGDRRVESDVVAHELVHVEQVQREPVTVVHSQRSVDMAELRRELEAYHVGSILLFSRIHKVLRKPAQSQNMSGDTLQCQVELIRQRYLTEHNFAPGEDPYRPSGALLSKIEEAGFGHILHNRPDYNQLVSLLSKS